MRDQQPEAETQAAFARRIRVSRARVTQLIPAGLPVTADGLVLVQAALAWVQDNLDPAARERGRENAGGSPAADTSFAEARRQREWANAARARLAYDKERDALAPWEQVNAMLVAWVQAERDSWLAWSARIVPGLAAELQCDAAALAAALRGAVEQQIRDLAAQTIHVGP